MTPLDLLMPPAVFTAVLGVRLVVLVLTADWRARKAGTWPAYNFIAMTSACILLTGSVEMFAAAFR